jgi:hypothetical protein
MASRLPYLTVALTLVAFAGCGDGSDDPARTPTPDIDVVSICQFDPAGLTPTVCTVFPTRTPTPTPR